MNGLRRIGAIAAALALVGCGPPPPSPLSFGKSKSKSKQTQPKDCAIPEAYTGEAKLLGEPDEVYDSYIVKYKEPKDLQTASIQDTQLDRLRQPGIRKEEIIPGYFQISFDNQQLRLSAISDLMNNPNIEYIEPDYPVELDSFKANDPLIPQQWAHEVVKSHKAWSISSGSKNVTVAVLDSGVDFTHPDLRGNMWRNPGEVVNGIDDDRNGYVDDIYGWDFANNNNYPNADDTRSYHGTHVAGTVGAVGGNGIGIAGHAPNVRIMALKFITSRGTGPTSAAIRAIDYAIRMKANVINNSWGSRSRSQALSDIITHAERAGILFVVSSGNNGSNNDTRPWYPANYPQSNIISVGASDQNDRLTSWSNFGARSVHIAAPGDNIASTRNGERYAYLSGTSMAAPLVSGVAATMIAKRPSLRPHEIISILTSTVDRNSSLQGRVSSGGRINAHKALQATSSYRVHTPDEPEETPKAPEAETSPDCP